MAASPVADNPNINISAYRVLYILLLLVQYRSLNVIELNRFLFENPLIQRIYNTETLTKYINTLREVGCDIPRASSRNDYSYELRRNPFPLLLAPEELEVARKLLAVLGARTDEVLHNDYRDFLEYLSWSLDTSSTQGKVEGAADEARPLAETETRRNLVKLFRRYCKEAFTLEVHYKRANQHVQEIVLEPHELIEQGRQMFLVGMDARCQQQMVIPLDNVVAAKQLPSKNKRPASPVTVVFALYGRLSKNYRPYPGEKIIYQSEDELQVKARVSEPTGLMNRLLKYGASCQVLSPVSIRQGMQQRIHDLLETLMAPDFNRE